MKTYIVLAIAAAAIIVSTGFRKLNVISNQKDNKIAPISSPTISLVPSQRANISTPTSKPLSIEEMNKIAGPCIKVNVLMYHHIEEPAEAKANKRTGLATSPEYFRKHLEYLKLNGYTTILPSDLINFFDNGNNLPAKPVMITLDDAYADNYSKMFPILKEYGFKATIFTPTGLMNNPDYLSWSNIDEMNGSGLVYFGNHTWSHHSSSGQEAVLQKEISLADQQLQEKGLNQNKVFAYPYGNPSKNAEKILENIKYKLAFTTKHGNIMCKGYRFELPRIRVGNASLSHYGL